MLVCIFHGAFGYLSIWGFMHFSLPILGWFEEDAPSEVVSFWAMESTATPMGDFDQEVRDFGILSTFFSWLIRYTRAMRCGCHWANPRSFTLTPFLVDPNLFAIFCWWSYYLDREIIVKSRGHPWPSLSIHPYPPSWCPVWPLLKDTPFACIPYFSW